MFKIIRYNHYTNGMLRQYNLQKYEKKFEFPYTTFFSNLTLYAYMAYMKLFFLYLYGCFNERKQLGI